MLRIAGSGTFAKQIFKNLFIAIFMKNIIYNSMNRKVLFCVFRANKACFPVFWLKFWLLDFDPWIREIGWPVWNSCRYQICCRCWASPKVVYSCRWILYDELNYSGISRISSGKQLYYASVHFMYRAEF